MDAKSIIAAEVARQDAMWGDSNDRADVSHGELIKAALAQLQETSRKAAGSPSAFDHVPAVYPPTWSGFRDYGSVTANLAVVAAYCENEIKRRLNAGEEHFRRPRDWKAEPYTNDQPVVID
jgi:hypothetical protein